MPNVPLRVVKTVRFIDAECRCCGHDALCQHLDRDLGGPVCRPCKLTLVDAEIHLLASGLSQPPIGGKGIPNN